MAGIGVAKVVEPQPAETRIFAHGAPARRELELSPASSISRKMADHVFGFSVSLPCRNPFLCFRIPAPSTPFPRLHDLARMDVNSLAFRDPFIPFVLTSIVTIGECMTLPDHPCIHVRSVLQKECTECASVQAISLDCAKDIATLQPVSKRLCRDFTGTVPLPVSGLSPLLRLRRINPGQSNFDSLNHNGIAINYLGETTHMIFVVSRINCEAFEIPENSKRRPSDHKYGQCSQRRRSDNSLHF